MIDNKTIHKAKRSEVRYLAWLDISETPCVSHPSRGELV